MPESTIPWRSRQLWIGLGSLMLLSAVVIRGVIEGNRNAQVEAVMLLVGWAFIAGGLVGFRAGVRRVPPGEQPVKESLNPDITA
ncbi:hypothetical protein ABZZ47_43445 [Streptomyces sp. NPDC006465]|uniref:hypothetical protein n=1 Tax=Streptomyces sp. NPDC006465 TaxID=3157174 RepID=UPI0033ADB7BB